MFKGLIFVQRLMAKKDAEIRVKILMKLEKNRKLILQEILNECHRILNLRRDKEETEEKMCIHIS